MDHQESGFTLIYWEDIRERVQAVNQPLAGLIDAISPDKHYPLVKASYRYGDSVVKDGTTYLPVSKDKGLLPITDPLFKTALKDYLTYSPIPLFLTLQNANEVYIHAYQRTVPLNLFYPGSLLGLFESLDVLYGRFATAPWSVSAGARNLFMLSKLNEQSGFKKLRKAYDLNAKLQPRHLTDHWQLFQAIAQHKDFTQPWQNEVLFFTKNWLLQPKNDVHWVRFKDYLVGQAWHQAQFAIGKIALNLTWERFAEVIAKRNLKPTSYMMDQVRHILLVALGRWPGFKVADTTNRVAPIEGLQNAIIDIYNLKKHLPTLLHINSSEDDRNIPLYYSLSLPILLEGPPSGGPSQSTIMIDARKMKQIIDTLIPTFKELNGREAIQLQKTDFDYFHVELDPYNEILSSQQLSAFDKSLFALQPKFPGRSFCATSQFWRGCVRISQKA